MADYIERKDALRAVNEFFHDPKVDIAINAVPSAPVREDVIGRPEKIFDNPYTGKLFTTCSQCMGKIGQKDRFCKHCGARMTGGNEK